MRLSISLLSSTFLFNGDESGFDEFSQFLSQVWILEVILERGRFALHLLQDHSHGGVGHDGLHLGVLHRSRSNRLRIGIRLDIRLGFES